MMSSNFRKPSSSHQSKGHSSKGNSKGSRSSNSHEASVPGVTSFLFVVNQLAPSFEPLYEDNEIVLSYEIDQWGNILPPTNPAKYGDEYVGQVFRYRDGVVTVAHGYEWVRSERGAEGYIVKQQDDDGNWQYPTPYRTRTVFACSPVLPLVVVGTDPSVNETSIRRGCSCDGLAPIPSVQRAGTTTIWTLMHFCHPQELRGVSQADLEARGRPYIAGRDAGWVQGLIPRPFRNTRLDENTPRSVGLSGDLPLVIALMAFWDSQNRPPGDLFARDNGVWQRRRWTGHGPPRGYPNPEDDPRGFLVHVCLDDVDNPDISNDFALWQLQWEHVLVKD